MPLLTTLVGALPKRTYTPYASGSGGHIIDDAYGGEYGRLQQHRPLADVIAMQLFLGILKQVQLGLDVPVVRIPMIAATDSDASRPPIPTHGGHFVAVSSGAV